ncbi:hypothetical protein QQ045_033668 [Rhodiola kirilowii]
MVTSSVSLSEKLAATSAEAVDHDDVLKLLQAEKAEVEALELELKELKQARKDATKRRAKQARPLSESGLQDEAPVSNEAMQELEDAKKQLDLDRSNFENEKFQLEVVQAQLGGKDSVSIEDKSRLIPARDLNIFEGDNPEHWKWTSVPETRYAVAELLEVCWHQIYGSLNASCLFPYTTYGAYLIFKLTDDSFGFEFPPSEASAAIPIGESYGDTRNIYLVAEEDQAGPERADEYPKRRADGWMEVELGTFFVNGDDDDDGKIKMSFIEIWDGYWRKGLIVLGIELRPTPDQKSNKKETVLPQDFLEEMIMI